MSALVLLLLIPALAWLTARWPPERTAHVDRWLSQRWMPLLPGLVSAAALWWIWGSLAPVEVVHDETAYLLQAQMLAHGHLAGPGRPMPEFFEQFQVFASPILAAKYPPGFALALVPGIWLGLSGLIPVLLVGLSGGMIFSLGRRIATPAVGLLAWAIWFVAPGSIPFRHLIMSQTLTTALWLSGWWCLLEWQKRGSLRWLLALAGLSAWCVLARPLTGIAYAVPLAVVTLVLARRHGHGRQLAPALGLAAAALCILLWQNRIVTGDWRRTAWSHYTAVYAPTDHFGFGFDSTPPQRALPPDFQDYVWYYGEFHKDFIPANLPRLFRERGAQLLHDAWGDSAPVAALLAGLGLAAGGSAALLAAGTGLLLVLVHLGFAHPSEWSIYYQEVLPVLAMLTALGAGRITALIGAGIRRTAPPAGAGQGASPALLLLTLVLLIMAPTHLRDARRNYGLLSDYHRRFRERVAALPGRSIVFVRYSRNHIFHRSLISNPADLSIASSWIVYDRGADNLRLQAAAPDRTPYLYFEHGDSLRAWTVLDTLPAQ